MSASYVSYFRYWGKARAEGAGPECHLLPYHCLDVAAAGDVLLRAQARLLTGVAEFLDVEPDALRCWLVTLLALHDVGKFADGFQNLRPDLLWRLQERRVSAGYDERHDTLGFRVLSERGGELSPIPALAGARGHGVDWDDLRELLIPWLAATAGHHGRPPNLAAFPRPLSHHFTPGVIQDVGAFVRGALNLVLAEGAPFDLADYDRFSRAFPRVSWLAAGLAVAADWIGSNVSWFPYRDAPMSLEEYWLECAVPQAQVAVAESGLRAAPVSAWRGVRGLFPKLACPTPLQRLAEDIELSAYPQLFIIEEVTGGGKTEAALALAHRLMAAGTADGVYFALPTMATANAMHRRIEEMFRRLFEPGSSPSLVLAHSASRLAQTLGLEERNRDSGETDREEAGSRQCAEWLADSRKKALLAHVGVGTVDQALLGVLAARHQSMRLFGLCRKVLIVDEVHACDAYVHRLLCTLLRFHAALGGSAVLLSATLPARMRRELALAFDQGLGTDAARPSSSAYPLVTHLGFEGLREYPVEARESTRRRVAVKPLRSEGDVATGLEETLESGACACWVRNTVDDALEAYRRWRDRLGEERVSLFHARYALGDRLERETEVMRLFGSESAAEQRRGRLLIATQVVEQSLDLDFDAMVSDLAPIDLLIQRTGRLKRHARDVRGNRIERTDERPPPELSVFMPHPESEASASWFASLFPGGARVYENHGQLWLTARWLQDRGSFAMPDDARAMIEGVYGEGAQAEVPAGLVSRTQRAEGTAGAMAAQGRLNSLDLDAGYAATATHWQDDAYAPTRLGEPTSLVRLARREGARLVPWVGGDPRTAWQLSQLTLRKARIAADHPEIAEAALAARKTMPDRGKYAVLIVLDSSEEGWSGRALNGRGEPVRVSYDARFGLQYLGGDA